MTRPTRRAPRWARLLRGGGELLLTAGVVVLLYAVYSLYWTNLRSAEAAGEEVRRLRATWSTAESTPEDGAGAAGAGTAAAPERGRAAVPAEADAAGAGPAPGGRPGALALLTIPRLGSRWVQPVVAGSADGGRAIGARDLARGVVHYPGTALPGQVGNFAVAGHRATNGEPFADLDRLDRGDEVLVETREGRYTYAVTGSEIVAPTRVDVLAPVPRRPGVPPDRARMTLTTCHPRYGSTSRLIVHTELVAAPKGRAPAPPASAASAAAAR